MNPTVPVLTPLEIDLLPIPTSLKTIPQWGVWRYESIDGKMKKPPYRTTKTKLSPSAPQTWLPLEEAAELLRLPGTNFKGLGFCFGGAAPYCGVDFDHCRDKDTGAISPVVRQLIRALNSYTEVSPSGTGVHVLVEADLPGRGHRGTAIEIYREGRFFTVTGNHLEGTPRTINKRQAAVTALYESLTVLEKLAAHPAKREDFERLFTGDMSGHSHDHSAADLALCSMAAWAGATEEQIDALVRLSGLYREKWERDDYRATTITKAMTRTGEAPQVREKASTGGGVLVRLSDVARRRPDWLWKPYLPRGYMTSLGGDSGVGKTAVITLIAARVTRGIHPYTGEVVGPPENVVIMCSENSEAEVLRPQMEYYGADLDRIFTLPYVLPVREVSQWEAILKEYTPALVIGDPIQEALVGAKMNDAAETRAALQPLLRFAEQYRTAIVWLCHLGKDAAEKKPQHRTLGSVNIEAMTRSQLLLEEVPGDTTGARTLRQTKVNLSAKGEDVPCRIIPHEVEPEWTVGVARWEHPAIPQPANKIERCAAMAREFLQAHGGQCPSGKLSTHLAEFAPATVVEALKREKIERKGGTARSL